MNKNESVISPWEPLPDKFLIAIGKLVTAWSSVETALSFHVARLICITRQENGFGFNLDSYHRAILVCMGTDSNASLAQISNLAELTFGNCSHSHNIKKATEKLQSLKERRNDVCHIVPFVATSTAVKLPRISVSRTRKNMSVEKKYHVEELTTWAHEMVENVRIIDSEITAASQWNNDGVRESSKQHSESHQKKDA